MEKRAEIQEYLKQNLSYIRYSHSLRVERTAVRIARQVGVDEYPCLIAGLAHDICREKIDSEIFTILGENSIIDNKFKRSNPLLLHGFAGAVLLAEKFLINDTSILNAVRYHTSGQKELDDIGKIVFAADYLEPERTHLDAVDRRRLLSMDLDEMLSDICRRKLRYLELTGKVAEPDFMDMVTELCKD